MSAPKALRIVELRAENVKRLKVVTIRPDGNVVTISGENGQGKSSTLDAIMYALAGKGSHPPEVIRRGEPSARVVADLGDLVVERNWTAETEHMKGGTTLEVRSKDGARFPSPQAMLDKLVGSLSFDPLAFLRLEPKKQQEALRQLVKLDFSELDKKHAAAFEKRAEVNVIGKAKRAQLDALPPEPEGLPEKPISLEGLFTEQEKRQAEKAENDRVRADAAGVKQRLSLARRELAAADELVTRLEQQLAEAEARTQKAAAEVSVLEEEAQAADVVAAALVDPDVSEVYRQVKAAEATNAAVSAARARRQLAAELDQLRLQKTELEKQLQLLDAEKQRQLAEAKFPVPGLGFGADGLTLDGFPLEQSSAAEQLRVSLGMGLALNPTLKVVLVRDGSLLSEKSLQLVAEMAAAADAQVWVERVSNDKTVGVVIEDGEVANTPPLKLVK